MVLKTSGDTIERKEHPRANPGTIKAWDHSSGHARATDHTRHPLPSPSGTHGATARRNKTPNACPEFQRLPRFPRIIPRRPTSSRLRSSRASRRPEALHAPRPLSLFCGVVKEKIPKMPTKFVKYPKMPTPVLQEKAGRSF